MKSTNSESFSVVCCPINETACCTHEFAGGMEDFHEINVEVGKRSASL